MLPAELWIKCLRWSTNVPDLYTDISFNPHRIEELDVSLKTKKSIVQVCRTWRAIGIEFLFEYIFLDYEFTDSESRTVDGLADIFALHVNEPGYGRCTKRIDFHLSLLNDWPGLPHFTALCRLLDLCHDLKALVIFPQPDACPLANIYQLKALIERRFMHSLKRMSFQITNYDLESTGENPRIFHYHLCIPDIPLQSLEIAMSYKTDPYAPPPLALTAISELTIGFPYGIHSTFPTWYCPQLRHLVLRHVADTEIGRTLAFVRAHGRQIISLEVDSHLHATSYLSFLHQLLVETPDIHILTLGRLEDVLNARIILPHLVHIRVYTVSGVDTDNRVKMGPWEFQMLQGLAARPEFPKLQRVTLLTESLAAGMGEYGEFQTQGQANSDHSVIGSLELLDHVGDIIGYIAADERMVEAYAET